MIFYRPNYCCHCGEKIERSRWTPLTSRRFCDFCEVEQKEFDLLPRVILVIAVLFGSAGLTTYIGYSGGNQTPKTDTKVASTPVPQSTAVRIAEAGTPESKLPAKGGSPVNANLEQRPGASNSSTEAVFYCGALTKKGTPCTRRVKSKGRCWQHANQPD